MALKANNLCLHHNGREIVKAISLHVKPHEFLGIVGPNGSGKSSLASLLSGMRKPTNGDVLLFNKSLKSQSSRSIARQIAFVRQHVDTEDKITARQAVELGRTPHLSFLSPWSCHDDDIVDRALDIVEMTDKQQQYWSTLSGGKRQRLHIARGLVQDPELLILDEPTNNLDIHHQLNLLSLIKKLRLTTIAVLHDLNHAAIYCDRIAVIEDGKLKCYGTPNEVLTKTTIESVFKVKVSCHEDGNGIPFIRFINAI